jgi:RNA polymerase sigma factor (sigma-70 family)
MEPTNLRLEASSPVEMGVDTDVGPAAAPDDSLLIHLVLTGNAECFGVLMDRHVGAVKGRIRAMTRCTSDADDIMQEVQLKIWRFLGSYRSESNFRTWMIRIAINEALQFYRKENSLPLVYDPIDLAELASSSESPLQACVRAELTERLKAAVERLPAKYRQVVVLHTLQELSLRETAQELQETTPAVKTQLFRAKAALSKALLRESQKLGSQRTFAPKSRPVLQSSPLTVLSLLASLRPQSSNEALTETRQLPNTSLRRAFSWTA